MNSKKEIAELAVSNTISTALDRKKVPSLRKKAIDEIYDQFMSGYLPAKKAVEILIEISKEDASEDFLGVAADARSAMNKILKETKQE